MKKQICQRMICVVLCFCMYLTSSSQASDVIEQLYSILYPKQVEIIQVEFNSNSGSFSFLARDFYPDYTKADSLLYSIRESNQYNHYVKLQDLLDTLESTFVNEWEPIWRKDIGRYDSFYNILRNIEETLQYLFIKNQLTLPSEKYSYLKNLILYELGSIYVDSHVIMVYSDYIHFNRHRACMTSDYCSLHLLDDIWFEIENDIIEDVCSLKPVEKDLAVKKYLYSLIIESRYSKNLAFDSCFLGQWELIDEYRISSNYFKNSHLIVSIKARNNLESLKKVVEKLDFNDHKINELLQVIHGSEEIGKMIKEKLRKMILSADDIESRQHHIHQYKYLVAKATLDEDIHFLAPYVNDKEIHSIKSRYNR